MPGPVAEGSQRDQGQTMNGEHEQSANLFHVEQHESLPDVLERLHGHRGEALTLVVPEHSPILLTATEFRALKELADRQHIRLGLETGDSLRLQLASMFGLAERTSQPEPETQHAESHGTQFGSWRNARRPRPRVPGQPPGGTEPAQQPGGDQDDDDPITVSRRRRNRLYRDSATRDEPEPDASYIDDAGLDYIEDDEDEQRHSRAWLYGRIAAAVLVVLALGLAALWYWFPSVQVDVTLREADVSTDIVYSVAAPDAQVPSDASFAVEANEQSAEVPFTIEIPASGVVRQPDQTASGSLLFRNVSEAPVTLEQGTELTTIDGTGYVLLEAVDVPAGSVEEPGEAQAPITAAEPGSGGNRDAGALTGKVPDVDVYYSNLNGPIEGGTDREYPVVTEEDRAAAERAVQEDLRSAAAEGWATQFSDGMAIVEPSVEPGEPEYTIEGNVDDRREAVVVSGTVSVTGLVYDLGEVEQQSRNTFEDTLQEQVPPGYELDPSTITLGEPELLAESPENVEYRVSATATARAIFDEGARDGLKERVAGSSVDEAEAAVDSVGAFETWQMSQSPDWWPERMPQSPDRVSISVLESPDSGGTPATPTGSPATTPEAGS